MICPIGELEDLHGRSIDINAKCTAVVQKHSKKYMEGSTTWPYVQLIYLSMVFNSITVDVPFLGTGGPPQNVNLDVIAKCICNGTHAPINGMKML